MKLTDILSTDPATGRALLRVPTYPIAFLLPCHERDFREMGRVRQSLVGSTTPGMTWRDGIFLALKWLSYWEGWKLWAKIVALVLHEIGHWWQLWRRMGPNDFPATYGWQGVIRLVRYGTAHLHQMHPLEREADAMRDGLLTAAWHAYNAAECPAGFVFDTEPWLQAHYPAQR